MEQARITKHDKAKWNRMRDKSKRNDLHFEDLLHLLDWGNGFAVGLSGLNLGYRNFKAIMQCFDWALQ